MSYSSLSSYYQIKAGSNTTTGSSGQTVQIESVLVHPNYSADTIDFDIALLKLRQNVTLSDRVGLIRISTNENYVPGSYASVSGWGYQQENGTLSPSLRHAEVPLASRSNCALSYANLIEITRNMVCAGYPEGGKDACQGDSGGPLVQNKRLIGVVSFGMGCARKSYPGVYTNVARLLDWVIDNSNYMRSGADSGSSFGYFGHGTIHKFDRLLMILLVIFCMVK